MKQTKKHLIGITVIAVFIFAIISSATENELVALHKSIELGDSIKLRKMISRGADINAKDVEGNTPLHIAVKNGSHKMASILVLNGVSINLKDKQGNTSLDIAIQNKNLEIVSLLFSYGAEEFDNSALHIATQKRSLDIVSLLISLGGDVNRKGEFDNTPLHISKYNMDFEISRLLEINGADLAVLNKYGLNPNEMVELPEIQLKIQHISNLLNDNGEWSNRNTALIYYNELKTVDKKKLVNSIVLNILKYSSSRLRTLIVAIKLGISGSESKLVDILMIYGSKNMAEDYLNSGSSILNEGGTTWARIHGFNINSGSGSQRGTWGNF